MPSTTTPKQTPNTTTAAQAVTVAMQFNDCGAKQLFAVVEGVPSADALYEASSLLAIARDISVGVAQNLDSSAPLAMVHMIEMAKAIVDSIAVGIERSTAEVAA